jgi:hypothetical protein
VRIGKKLGLAWLASACLPLLAVGVGYKVKPGDTLWRIAQRPEVYGDPWLWPLLLDANHAQVADENSPLKQGAVLQVPLLPTEAEKAAARLRAHRALERRHRVPSSQPPATAAQQEKPTTMLVALYFSLVALMALLGAAVSLRKWKERRRRRAHGERRAERRVPPPGEVLEVPEALRPSVLSNARSSNAFKLPVAPGPAPLEALLPGVDGKDQPTRQQQQPLKDPPQPVT